MKAEASGFRTLIYSDDQRGQANNRKLLQVYLNGKFELLSDWQAIDLSKYRRYTFASGAQRVDGGVWDDPVLRLVSSMRLDVRAPSLLQLVLAATRRKWKTSEWTRFRSATSSN